MTGLPEAQLVVVSSRTAYAAQIDAFVEANGLKERVRFLSGIGADELALVYKLATAFVYPSFYEGFGIPILEALSSGVPVVTTRGGVFGEVGGPGSAYVDPKDPDELRGVLASIMGDAARRASMREAGLAHAALFGEVAIARNLLAAYTRAIANRLRP